MIDFKPVPFNTAKPLMSARAIARPSLSATPEPPPMPDFLFTGYTGISGVLETLLVLGITGAAAYVGIQTGLDKSTAKPMKVAGWVGGLGSALMGLLYLGAKTGVGDMVGLPAVRVSPS